MLVLLSKRTIDVCTNYHHIGWKGMQLFRVKNCVHLDEGGIISLGVGNEPGEVI